MDEIKYKEEKVENSHLKIDSKNCVRIINSKRENGKYKKKYFVFNNFFERKDFRIKKENADWYVHCVEKRNIMIDFFQKYKPEFLQLINVIEKEIYISNDDSLDFEFGSENDQFNPVDKVIQGDMQSGKTEMILCIVIYYSIVYNISSLVLLQNTTDMMLQFLNRLEKFFEKIKNFSKKILPCKYARGRCLREQAILNAIDENEPYILVCLRSKTDIQPVTNALEKTKRRRLVCVFDESDFTDSGAETKCDEMIGLLKENTNTIYNITATPLTTLFKENIDIENVFFLKNPNNYKSPNHLDIQKVEGNFASQKVHNPFEFVPRLKTYIDSFSERKSYNFTKKGYSHPVISLVRTTSIVDNIEYQANYSRETYSKEITTITYNGGNHGITLFSDSLIGNKIQLGKGKYSYSNGLHRFIDVHISLILDFLRERGAEKHPRIMIFAGKKTDRALSYTSSYEKAKNKIPWHLTEMFVMFAGTCNQSNILQTIGRLCGTYNDNIVLTLFTNIPEDVKKSYNFQKELMERSCENENKNSLIKEVIPEVQISAEKVPIRRISNAIPRKSFSIVKDDLDFGGYDWDLEERFYKKAEADFNVRKLKIKKPLTEEELIPIRIQAKQEREEGKNDKLKKKNCVVDGKIARYCSETTVNTTKIQKNLFDYLYKCLEEKQKDTWYSATDFYRKDGTDRQNTVWLFDKGTEKSGRGRSFLITKNANGNFALKLESK